MPITVDLRDWPATLAQRLRADTEIARRAALEAAQRTVADAVRLTNEAGAVDQGLYKLSWTAAAVPGGAEVGNSAPYAAVIEYGRRPGRPGPPLAPILGWVQRKLGVKGAEAYPVAVAIQRRIHDRGTKPRRILLRSLAPLRAYFAVALRRELGRKP